MTGINAKLNSLARSPVALSPPLPATHSAAISTEPVRLAPPAPPVQPTSSPLFDRQIMHEKLKSLGVRLLNISSVDAHQYTIELTVSFVNLAQMTIILDELCPGLTPKSVLLERDPGQPDIAIVKYTTERI